jgi:hypothetical protein
LPPLSGTPIPVLLEPLLLSTGCVWLLYPEFLVQPCQFFKHLEFLRLLRRTPLHLVGLGSQWPHESFLGRTDSRPGPLRPPVVDLLQYALPDVLEVVVAGAGAYQVLRGEPPELLVALPLVQLRRDEPHLLPLLLRHDRRLPHLQHPVTLGHLQ